MVSDDLMTPIKVLILIKVSLPARAEGPCQCHPWLGRWKLAKTAKNTDSETKKHRFIDNWQCRNQAALLQLLIAEGQSDSWSLNPDSITPVQNQKSKDKPETKQDVNFSDKG